ncbi:MAG: hydantoinase/oxoprolinase family protein, partial [Gammaproteobacteria bacterium]
MSTHIFGWDIGGAHLKVARLDPSGVVDRVHQVACPLWRGVGELARAVRLVETDLAVADAVHAVTMTGELCDNFATRAAGVRDILDALTAALGDGARVRVFGGYAGWLSPAEAATTGAVDVASANWLALAAHVAERMGDGVLIDVGSTTTDIIPLHAGEPCAAGRDDATRLAHGELVYTGVVRTPVASLCQQVPFDGRWQPLAAEYFANAADVHRLCGALADGLDLMPTA